MDLSGRLESSQRSEEQKLTLQKDPPVMDLKSPIKSQGQNLHQPEEEQKVELQPRRKCAKFFSPLSNIKEVRESDSGSYGLQSKPVSEIDLKNSKGSPIGSKSNSLRKIEEEEEEKEP